MKKIIFILAVFLLNFAQGFDYNSYCSKNIPSKTFSGNLNSVLGVNFLTRSIAEAEIERAIKKETNSKVKINIDTFYGTNSLNGEFKNLTAISKNYNYKGFYGSNLQAHTICSYNKISYKDKKLVFVEPMVLEYSTDITQQDLDKIIASSSYQEAIDALNSTSIVEIQNPKVSIRDNRLVFKFEVMPLPKFITVGKVKPVDIIFGANLKVEDNKLLLCDFDFNSFKFNYNALLPVINALNPLSYKVKIDKNNNGELKIEEVKIANSKINVKGFVIIPKGS